MSNLAVVTGGTGGMGLAVARALGRDGPVLICDLDQKQLDTARAELEDAGVNCSTTVCDVSDPQSVRRLTEHACSIGDVTSVVHTAGVSPSMGSAELILRINAMGTVLLNQAFLEIAHDRMALVNVASTAGHQLPKLLRPTSRYRRAFEDPESLNAELLSICKRFPRQRRPQIAYVLSKNFVIWFSAAMAARFGAKGARVMSVSPGSFDTTMGRLEESRGAAAMAELGALKRFGRPEEIAELLAFCAGAKPGFLTGSDIICDGGSTAAMSVSTMIDMARRH